MDPHYEQMPTVPPVRNMESQRYTLNTKITSNLLYAEHD
jgi:hypothetical protein